MDEPRYPMTPVFEDQKMTKPSYRMGLVITNGKELVLKGTGATAGTVRATYRIMRALQLRHIAALEHNFPSINFYSVTAPRGRYRL